MARSVGRLEELSELIRPPTLARDRTVPLCEPLRPLSVDAALIRGSILGVHGIGATSLTLALVAEATRTGSWVAVVGLADLGLAAAADLGVVPARTVLVDIPPDHAGARTAEVVAALIGGVDIIVMDGRLPMGTGHARRLAARGRERGTIVVVVSPDDLGLTGSGPTRPDAPSSSRSDRHGVRERGVRERGVWEIEVELVACIDRWEGLGVGHGHLRRRRLRIDARGRRRAARPRSLTVMVPDDGGAIGSTGTVIDLPHRDSG